MSFLKEGLIEGLSEGLITRPEPNLTDRTTARLLDEITGGQYQPGDVLPPEHVIAERLGVSRTVLREAVSRLKAEGIVASKQGRGLAIVNNRRSSVLRMAQASEHDIDEVLAITELRLGFEIEAAAFAAHRRDEADLGEMRSALEQMRQAIASGEVSAGVEADLRFHEAIARATRNRNYITFFDFLGALYRRNLLLSRSRSAKTKNRGKPAQEEHEAIFQAIAQGDADAARRAARIHVENTAARLRAAGNGVMKQKRTNRAA
jgi:GntR family transcriptional regulator, transcriptional repressor for pyruvate dehydrogenase complex